MRLRSLTAAMLMSLVAFALMAQVALAGEWAPGRTAHNGAPEHAKSWCVYNGHDDDDPEDDEIWSLTPAGGVVQSGGQMIAAQAQGVDLGLPPEEAAFPGVQGFACNPNIGGTPADGE
jgi:hypothetical protein